MTETVSVDNLEYKNPLHCEHLCYIISQGFNFSDKQQYDSLVNNPKFRCAHCERVANIDKNLCEPVEL